MNYSLALMTGVDIPIPFLQSSLHQPTIKEISYIGEEEFLTSTRYISLNKEQLIADKNVSSQLTNFQVLMKVLEQKENRAQRDWLISSFLLLFPNSQAMITPNSIILNNLETSQSVLIDENNFEEFQQIIKQVLCIDKLFDEGQTYNPTSEKAQKIMEKIMQGRQKVAAIKNKGNKTSILSRYISILSVGLQWPLDQCTNLTLYQLFDIMERYNLYQDWEADFRIKLAGGSSDSQVENWMQDIH